MTGPASLSVVTERAAIRGAGRGELGQEFVLLGLEVVRPGEEHPGETARGDVAAFGVRAALVDVLVQEVEAAGEAEGFDLVEEVPDGDGGVLGPAFAQVVAVGVDEIAARYLGTRSIRSGRSARA